MTKAALTKLATLAVPLIAAALAAFGLHGSALDSADALLVLAAGVIFHAHVTAGSLKTGAQELGTAHVAAERIRAAAVGAEKAVAADVAHPEAFVREMLTDLGVALPGLHSDTGPAAAAPMAAPGTLVRPVNGPSAQAPVDVTGMTPQEIFARGHALGAAQGAGNAAGAAAPYVPPAAKGEVLGTAEQAAVDQLHTELDQPPPGA